MPLARAEPDWSLGIEHLEQLPGIRRNLQNLKKLAKKNPKKLHGQADELDRLLESQSSKPEGQ